jgi:undecaprenyl-diphosphatase
MINLIEILKAFIFGIVEGITEWLPISSTGHMILLDRFLPLQQSDAFKELFLVVIQLGAILAVVVLYWRKLNPFVLRRPQAAVSPEPRLTSATSTRAAAPARAHVGLDRPKLILWLKIIIACVPVGLIGIKFNDEIDAIFYNDLVVSITLVLYGVLFILVERWNRRRQPQIKSLAQLSYKTALFIGLIQLLTLIPGTSRSGATILGAILLGASRSVAAEFSFFLGIPIMFGASLVKLASFGLHFTATELAVLLVAMVVAFVLSAFAIRFLVGYVKKHDFTVFGWYRIVLGLLVLVLFRLF